MFLMLVETPTSSSLQGTHAAKPMAILNYALSKNAYPAGCVDGEEREVLKREFRTWGKLYPLGMLTRKNGPPQDKVKGAEVIVSFPYAF